LKRIVIFNTNFSIFNKEKLINYLRGIIRKKTGYITFVNVHTVTYAKQNKNFTNVLNNSIINLMDGMPLVWCAKINGYKKVERCSGPDVMELLIKISELENYSHYFYGGTNYTLNSMINKIKYKYPNIRIAGHYSPPFRNLTEKEEIEIFDSINNLSPDIIWIGLGAPKQEYWMFKNIDKLKSGIMFGVGAAFKFYSGEINRAPSIMQKTGFEWFYRFIKEPKRLWKRYLSSNYYFLIYFFLDCIIKRSVKNGD
jgi:N-acetylglucosaminyldiphosphoundecaprenol N-acetyl-beta-D-mannosaminyltransferase